MTYIFTHDSIFVGEDGPTHQPVEHLASLRAVPNLLVLRPGDAEETVLAWRLAMESASTPVVLALSRQGLPVYEKPAAWEEDARRGAYVVKDCEGTPDVVVVATGSEVSLALAAAGEAEGRRVRVVSMLSRELFLSQDEAFRERIGPRDERTVVVEAGVALDS